MSTRLNPAAIRQQIDSVLLRHPELADDEQLRADMLEGLTDLDDFLRLAEQKRQEAASMAGALATNIAEMEIRQGRFERRERAMRDLMFLLLQAADLRKVEIPEATLSIARGQRKLIGEADPETLPDALCRIKREANKSAIKAEIESGRAVPGFQLSNAEPHLTIRTR